MTPRLTVLIVNWNGRDDTLACLQSLAADDYPAKRIVVVDNGSTDDSVAAIARHFPSVEVVSAGQNLGFTGGNNLGLERVATPLVLLLNNDTVTAPDAISKLVAAAEAGTGMGSPLIGYFDEPTKPWFAGSSLDLEAGTAFHDNAVAPVDRMPLPWLSGCCMLMRTELLRSLGGFDDRFFLNWEDVDLSLRVRARGLSLWLLPSAKILHKVGRSLSNTGTDGLYYAVRNNLLLLDKHSTGSRGKARVIGRAFTDVARRARHGRPWLRPLGAVLQAVNDYAHGRFGPRHRP